MSYFRKKLERRTFSQDRYYILIKKQREGRATFSELTELDEIVNRVPDIRDLVIRENFGEDEAETGKGPNDHTHQNQPMPVPPQSLWTRIKKWINHVFNAHIFVSEKEEFAPLAG